MSLSKSNFIKGMQCEKSLSLHFHKPELRDEISPEQEAIFALGHQIGELAQNLFPGGVDASRGEFHNYKAAVEYTQSLISEGQKVLYEACFQFGECLCYMDILVNEAGKWKAYEVKGSTRVKDYYYQDAAFQYYVITGSGLDLKDISIVHLNNKYVKQGELKVDQLFTFNSVLQDVLALQDKIVTKVPEFLDVIKAKIMPKKDIGPHCSSPFNCDFMGHCWSHLPKNSIFNISGLRSYKKWELYEQDVLEFDQIPDDFQLSEKQKIQVDCELNNTTHINTQAIKEFQKQLIWPLNFVDFETFSPAIPIYDNTRPYQRVPFQWSLHVQNSPESDLEHFEYLGTPPDDPRIEFIRLLINRLGSNGSVMVYNQGFEMSVLRELARDFPQFALKIDLIIDRIVDLMVPFRAKDYYLPEMKGSYSIKDVLPAVVPGYSYEELGIKGGSLASLTYIELFDEADPEIIDQKRKELLEYCALDTLSMKLILQKL